MLRGKSADCRTSSRIACRAGGPRRFSSCTRNCPPTRVRLQLQAQRCRRGGHRELRRTEAESPAAALARRQLQAAQAVGRQTAAKHPVEPQQRGRHAAAAQGLDPRPQGIARTARKHQMQAVETNPGGGPGRRMGVVRRRHQQNGLPGVGQRRQRRQQQAEFADAFVLRQQFGQCAAWPAAAGQFGIEGGKAAGKSRRWRHGEGVAAADVAALQRPCESGVHGLAGSKLVKKS
jgi:hypothetical protein